MARGNTGSEDDDGKESHHRYFIGHLATFLSLKGMVNNHFYTLSSGFRCKSRTRRGKG